MSPTARAALLGGGLAILLVAAGVALVVSGVVTLPSIDGGGVDRVLVIATAPEDDSVSARFAFVASKGQTSVELLDTEKPVVVSGTSADNAAEAYPYVGGAGVARVLAEQTDGEVLEWVVIPSATWAALVDDSGGITVDLPTSISVYRDGELQVLEAGDQRLDGAQAVALASAVGFIEDEKARESVQLQLAAGISSLVASAPERLAELVESGDAESSLGVEELAEFGDR